jgi:hypothetical protein
MENNKNNKKNSYVSLSINNKGSRSVGTNWGVKSISKMNNTKKIYNSNNIDQSYFSDSSYITSNSANTGGISYIHSYVNGRYTGLHEPGSYDRPVFGVNPDTYFLGNHKYYPEVVQPPSINDNTYNTLNTFKKSDNSIQGFGWDRNTMYPLVPIAVQNDIKNLDEKKNKKNKKITKIINKNVKDLYVI